MNTREEHLTAIEGRFGKDATLRRSVATNRALLSALPDVMLRVSSSGIITNVHGSPDDRWLVPTSDWIGQPVAAVLGGHQAQQLVAAVQRTLALGQTQVVEMQLLLAGSLRVYEARVVASDEAEALAIVRDVTERTALERMKLEGIALVSHELRAPLTSIRGAMGLLLRGVGELPPSARALVEVAHNTAGRLVRLINTLLDSDKLESGTMVMSQVPVDLMRVINEALVSNQAYGAQFGVRFRLEERLPEVVVYADEDRLIQVFTNLLSNAAKFSPPGETVTVAVTRRGSAVRVSVRDRGPGIPEAFRSRIFQRFAQAPVAINQPRHGTGLGLSIARSIVEQLGGEIGFELAPASGTTFYVDLPEYHQAAVEVGGGDRVTR